MATLITQDFDLFTSCGANIQIPHAFADLCRNVARQEIDARDNLELAHHHRIAFKVPMIKFIRGHYKDANGGTIGLKDAKDIMDHYYATKDQQRNIGGTQY